MKLKSGFKKIKIENDVLVIEAGGNTVDLRTALCLNPAAELIFDALTEECDEKKLVEILLSSYDIDETTAKKDLALFISKMKEKDMLA